MKRRDPLATIRQIARDVRVAMEATRRIHRPCCWQSDLAGACSAAALVVTAEIRRAGLVADLAYGDVDAFTCHCWTVADARWIVDVTATQFGGPPVLVAERSPIHDGFREVTIGRAALPFVRDVVRCDRCAHRKVNRQIRGQLRALRWDRENAEAIGRSMLIRLTHQAPSPRMGS